MAKTKFLEGSTYREPAITVQVKELLSFEEKICNIRNRIPGPLRRLLGLVLFVPVFIVSFIVTICLSPIVWIVTGKIDKHCDRQPKSIHGFDQYFITIPLLRGTSALFGDNDVYEDIRLGKRKKINQSELE